MNIERSCEGKHLAERKCQFVMPVRAGQMILGCLPSVLSYV
jgi:hypothetical protein